MGCGAVRGACPLCALRVTQKHRLPAGGDAPPRSAPPGRRTALGSQPGGRAAFGWGPWVPRADLRPLTCASSRLRLLNLCWLRVSLASHHGAPGILCSQGTPVLCANGVPGTQADTRVACICPHARCGPVDLTCDTSGDNVTDFRVMARSVDRARGRSAGRAPGSARVRGPRAVEGRPAASPPPCGRGFSAHEPVTLPWPRCPQRWAHPVSGQQRTPGSHVCQVLASVPGTVSHCILTGPTLQRGQPLAHCPRPRPQTTARAELGFGPGHPTWCHRPGSSPLSWEGGEGAPREAQRVLTWGGQCGRWAWGPAAGGKADCHRGCPREGRPPLGTACLSLSQPRAREVGASWVLFAGGGLGSLQNSPEWLSQSSN